MARSCFRRIFQATTMVALELIVIGSLAQGLPPPLLEKSAQGIDAVVKPVEFEVVSVRQHNADDGNRRWMGTPDGINATNIQLQAMAAGAYGIKMDLVSGGPSWMDTLGFDVQAKVAGSDIEAFKKITPEQRNLMLRALLADRFQLKAHVETKTLPVYELVVAKGGLKMKTAAPETPDPDAKPGDPPKNGGGMSMSPGNLEAHKYVFSSLADQLGYIVQRTVVDKTDLTGKYDFTLKWTPEGQMAGVGTGQDDSAPSIFTALQEQLGLKLVPSKGPVQTLVIDHADMPTAN